MRRILLVICLLLFNACAALPYQPHGELYPAEEPTLEKDEPQFSHGAPMSLIDGLGHYLFSLPTKLILWNWNMGNHHISPETEAALVKYLEENKLTDVKVRLNEYAPIGEWNRLTRNTSVGAGWRYTVGIINWLFYTVFPGRLFGGDNYNPFTNTVSLYSNHIAVALHEGGHAKDTASHEYKGSWAVLRILPLWPLRDEAIATSDALSYMEAKNQCSDEEAGYKVLYPAYGTYIGGEIARWVPGGILITAAAAIPGHIVGRIRAADVEPDMPHCVAPKTSKTPVTPFVPFQSPAVPFQSPAR